MKNILTVNIGNTSCSLVVFSNNDIILERKFPIKDFQKRKKDLDKIVKLGLEITVISSVNPVLEKKVKNYFSKKNIKTFQISYKNKLNFKNRYFTPGKLGSDRVANLAGAADLFKGNRIIIDSGTAITIDGLNSDNVFIGGVIIPGRILQSRSLHSFTKLLPEVNPNLNIKFPGLITRECISAGVNLQTEFGVKGIVKEFKKYFKTNPIIIGTGGDISIFDNIKNVKYINNLTHFGLKKIFQLNKNKFV